MLGEKRKCEAARVLRSILNPRRRALTQVNDALKHANVEGALPMLNAVNHHAKDRHEEERHAAEAAYGHLAKQ